MRLYRRTFSRHDVMCLRVPPSPRLEISRVCLNDRVAPSSVASPCLPIKVRTSNRGLSELSSAPVPPWPTRKQQYISSTWEGRWGFSAMAVQSQIWNGPCSTSGTALRERWVPGFRYPFGRSTKPRYRWLQDGRRPCWGLSDFGQMVSLLLNRYTTPH